MRVAGFTVEGGEGWTASDDDGCRQLAHLTRINSGHHTNRAFHHGPQSEPRTAGCASISGFDTYLDNADCREEDTDETRAEQCDNTDFLATRHLQVGDEPYREEHD